MPITQDRLKSVIDAGQSIADTYISTWNTLLSRLERYRTGNIQLEHLLEFIEVMGARPEIAIASQMLILSKEDWKYKANHSKNIREAKRLARRRAGLKPAQAQPTQVIVQPKPASIPKVNQVYIETAKTELPINSDTELDLGAEPDFVPVELDEETKRKIQREMETLTEQAKYTERYGQKPAEPKGQSEPERLTKG